MKTDIEQGESEMAKTDIAVKLDMPTPSTVLTKTLFECHACGVVSFETTSLSFSVSPIPFPR